MSDDKITIITNHQPRPILDSYELSADERKEFDYLDWNALDAGEDSASFIRYRGALYDLGDFQYEGGLMKNSPIPAPFAGWHGFISDGFFSGVLVRVSDDNESAVMGRYYS